jgi:uncharacterized membrane protein
MDSISGVYFGLHLITYLWIYVGVQVLKQFVFSRNIVFYLLIAAVSVLLELIFLTFSIFIGQGREGLSSLDYFSMAEQIFWACIIIPPAFSVITKVQKSYELILTNISGKIKKKSDYYN